MASFQTVMRDWARMCTRFHEVNRKYGSDLCFNCPIKEYCGHDSFSAKDVTSREIKAIEAEIEAWADGNPEPVYPMWFDWLNEIGVLQNCITDREVAKALLDNMIPADLAQKLGIKPKEV